MPKLRKESSTRSKRRGVHTSEARARLAEARRIEKAMQRSVREALREHKRRGESIVVWQDGRVVTLKAEDIPVGD